MKIVLLSKCFLDIEQYVEFKMSILISPSKSLISSCWVTYFKDKFDLLPLNECQVPSLYTEFLLEI